MSLLWLLGCAGGTGSVEVALRLSDAKAGPDLAWARAEVQGLSLRAADAPWGEGWTALAPVEEVVFDGQLALLARERLPAGRYDHVELSLGDVLPPYVCGDEPTVTPVLEPIAAPFRLRDGDALRLEIGLLALADLGDPLRVGLYAVETLVEDAGDAGAGEE
jgi:hypothetical protein